MEDWREDMNQDIEICLNCNNQDCSCNHSKKNKGGENNG